MLKFARIPAIVRNSLLIPGADLTLLRSVIKDFVQMSFFRPAKPSSHCNSIRLTAVVPKSRNNTFSIAKHSVALGYWRPLLYRYFVGSLRYTIEGILSVYLAQLHLWLWVPLKANTLWLQCARAITCCLCMMCNCIVVRCCVQTQGHCKVKVHLNENFIQIISSLILSVVHIWTWT